MNTTCTCGVKFMDAEDWRDHMPCPGSELEILLEEVKQLRLESGEVGDQNALLGMENDRLKLEIQKLNNYLMDRNENTIIAQPDDELKITLREAELIRNFHMGDTYSGNREDVKAAFQKIDDFVIAEWNKESNDDDWKMSFMLNAGHPKDLDPESPACVCGDYRCWGRHNSKIN